MSDTVMFLSDSQGEILKEISSNESVIIKKKRFICDSTFVMHAGAFVKLNMDEVGLVLVDLSAYEQVVLFCLVAHVGYEDCCIKRRVEGGYVELGANDIAQMCNISRSKVYACLASLVAKDLLYKGRNSKRTQYFMNPWICNRGARLNNVLKTMFQNYRIRSIGSIRWGDIN